MDTIGIIGCGNMGSALIRAIASSDTVSSDIVVFDIDTDKAASLASAISGRMAASVQDLQESCDLTIVAVKPQVLPSLYPALSQKRGQPYISIAAGVSIDTLSRALSSSKIARFMPNIAASVGKAVTAVAFHPDTDQRMRDLCVSLAETCGAVTQLPEHLFPAFIGISGSAIAFFYQFLHAVALGGTKMGIPYPESVRIASETFSGAVDLMLQSGNDPGSLLTSVISVGGTTIAGIHELEKGGLNSTVMSAVEAATQRAIDLESLANK